MNKLLNRKIILIEDVVATDRFGANFMLKGTKGVLIEKNDNTSSAKIGQETYELPNACFLEVMDNLAA